MVKAKRKTSKKTERYQVQIKNTYDEMWGGSVSYEPQLDVIYDRKTKNFKVPGTDKNRLGYKSKADAQKRLKKEKRIIIKEDGSLGYWRLRIKKLKPRGAKLI